MGALRPIFRARSPWVWLLILAVMAAFLTAIGPAEKSLGQNLRVVYLHGAWVWTALLFFAVSGLIGLVGLVIRNPELHTWSRALGCTGLLFWISYLPLSMWAMQTNWNGLYLAEPRWRLALVFAITGLLMQTGLALIERPVWTSAGNLVFGLALFVALSRITEVMHPRSPILQSGSRLIQIYFIALLIVTLLAAWQITRLWIDLGTECSHPRPI